MYPVKFCYFGGFHAVVGKTLIIIPTILLAKGKHSQFVLCCLVRFTWKNMLHYAGVSCVIPGKTVVHYIFRHLQLQWKQFTCMLQFPNTMFVLFTLGEVMEDLAFKLLRVTPSTFQPTHARNLGNKFACFVNYDSDLNKWQKMSVNNAKLIDEYCHLNNAIENKTNQITGKSLTAFVLFEDFKIPWLSMTFPSFPWAKFKHLFW